jgi:hypothetical protein
MELHRPGRLPGWWRIPAVALALVLVLVLVVWWMRSPQSLPVDADGASTTTKVGSTVYIGLLGDDDDKRSLTVRSIELGEGVDGATVEALVCRGGRVAVTTNADPFCEELLDAEGADLELPSDQLLVSVTADEPMTVSLDGLEITFREGLQWGSQRLPHVTVEVVGT